ncbi:MAG: N-methylhydantoinase [Solirubrobacteraceae bacterium]|jgi:N-methylhydantoinase A|nr:N-methylhydantoinase [Solirubrobacteraceae bacterium]
MAVHVAVDIGGTFTDLVAVDDASGRLHVEKAPSSRSDPLSAVRHVMQKAKLPVGLVSDLVHGTTVATNALLERDGPRIAFVTNRGFRDVLFVQDGTRRDLYSLEWEKPAPLVARYDCLEVGCRIDARGREIAPLDAEDVERVVEHLRREGIRSVAVGLLFAHVDAAHELALEAALLAAMPDLNVSVSHRVYPRWRENDRWQTVVADAYLKSMFSRYVRNLEHGLRDEGLQASLVLMKSNGGVVRAATAAEQPVNYLVSGPVGGVIGGTRFAALAGIEQVMTIDIGGTSSDVSLVSRGAIPRVAKFQLDHGIPVRAPMVDITTIGSGGGSIGWIDAGGLLRVGPRSAGSAPGPACFGQGGTEPTLTDANLLLGRLDPASFAGGEMRLDAGAARAALQRLAGELGGSPEDTADAMLRLATHDMVDALSVISVDRGIDPRDFALVAFGGAGGLHAADVAHEIGMRTVLIPPFPGNTSAYGLLSSGLRVDLSTTLVVRSDDPTAVATVDAALSTLHERTLATLRREGPCADPEVDHRLEMRYLGQNHHREIPIPAKLPFAADDLAAAIEAFHQDYDAFYGYHQPTELIEIVGALVTASSGGRTVTFNAPAAQAPSGAPVTRPVRFGAQGFLETAVVARDALGPGWAGEGPLVVEESSSTTVVPPGWRLSVHASGSLTIECGERR